MKYFSMIACITILLLAGCTKFAVLDAIVPVSGYHRTANLTYGPLPRQKLDVYQPTHADPAGRVVIFYYGGDWQNGDKADYRFVGQALASEGFIAVLPDYRLYPSVTFPAFVQDGAAAVKWTHDNIARFGGDPRHVYLMGHSAGAHIAALVTMDGRYLQAVGLDRSAVRGMVGLAGPYDFVPPVDDRAAFGMSRDDTNPSKEIEPIHFVDGREPPMLLIQGLQDTTVYPSNAEHLTQAIRTAGGKVQYIPYPDSGHVEVCLALAGPFRWLEPTLRDVSKFLREN
jgi:acetyl esterase/lipase